MFIKNAWYVGATAKEVADKPLGRKICNERVVFFRDQENKVSCIEDWCPHRGAQLSLGFVTEGNITCGYHGLVVNGQGKCVSMPGQRTRGFPGIRSFPVIERYGFIWIWPGDPEQADPAKLHHLHWAESPDWAYDGGLFHIACDYRLMIDNLMDLTHETYVHASSIGQKEIDESPVNTRVEGTEAITSRFMDGIKAPPFWRAALEANGLDGSANVDRWQICRFNPPSHVMIEVGCALAGNGGYDAPADKKVSSVVVDFITPETDTTHHYFWGMARNFNVKDQALTDMIRNGQHTIFSEDLAMLEMQQKNLLEQPNRHLLRLNIDAGGFQSRRIIERLIAEEHNGAMNTQPEMEPAA